MLSYFTDQYTIEVSDSSASASNSDFYDQVDAVYFNNDEYAPTSAVLIKVFNDGELQKKVLIGASGGGTGVHKSHSIFKGDRLVICCSDTIFCISIPGLNLLWNTKADMATCFQVFEYQNDYIVHGEVEISRIDEFGKIVWQRSGADIFASLKGKPDDFAITADYILATDWNGDKYKFDFDGNIISPL